jgi:hypothetical protein
MYLKGIVLFAQPQVLPRQTSNYINTASVQLLVSRVARIFLVQHTKTGKINQMTINIPNGRQMNQMAVK